MICLLTNFEDADLSYSSFKNSKLGYLKMIGANLSNAIFENVQFEDCIMDDVLSKNAVFKNCNFIKTNFFDADFEGSKFDSCTFVESELKYASSLDNVVFI